MPTSPLMNLTNKDADYTQPIKLYDDVHHQIYWVGIYTGGEEIECNSYLIVNGGEGFLLEPGGYDRFAPILDKVNQVSSAEAITHLFFSHQDPDVCASLPSWLEFNPNLNVVVSHLWVRFLPHYMAYDVNYMPMRDDGLVIDLHQEGEIRCLAAPYLHSPGSMVVFDAASGFLFTGDIGASLYRDSKPRLVIDDWNAHVVAMKGFHQRYMGSNQAVTGFLDKLKGLEIKAILPQHGAIFRGEEIERYIDWISHLPVGVDYLYAAER